MLIELYVIMFGLKIYLFEYKLVQENYYYLNLFLFLLMEMMLNDNNQMVKNLLFDDNFENVLMAVLHVIHDLIHLRNEFVYDRFVGMVLLD